MPDKEIAILRDALPKAKGVAILQQTDKELAEEVLKGEKEAFSFLIDRYQKDVYTLAYRYLGNREEALDASQEAFIKAYQGLKGFHWNSSFKTWLYQITSNVCRDHLRRRNKEPLFVLDKPFQTTTGEITLEVVSSSEPPEMELEKKELMLYLQSLLNSLSEEFKTVIILREIEGMSYETIACTLKCSLGTVKSRLNRARRALRDQIIKDQELFHFNESQKG